jgi:hypothetical protein
MQDVKSDSNVNMVREIREAFVNPPDRDEDDEESRLH